MVLLLGSPILRLRIELMPTVIAALTSLNASIMGIILLVLAALKCFVELKMGISRRNSGKSMS